MFKTIFLDTTKFGYAIRAWINTRCVRFFRGNGIQIPARNLSTCVLAQATFAIHWIYSQFSMKPGTYSCEPVAYNRHRWDKRPFKYSIKVQWGNVLLTGAHLRIQHVKSVVELATPFITSTSEELPRFGPCPRLHCGCRKDFFQWWPIVDFSKRCPIRFFPEGVFHQLQN